MDNIAAMKQNQEARRLKVRGSLKKAAIVAVFLLPFMTAFLVFFVYPLFYGIYISLTNFQFSAPGAEKFNHGQWYKMIFAPNSFDTAGMRNAASYMNEAFWRSFLHSFIFSVIMVPIAVLVPLGLAILVNLKPPGFKAFRAIIYMPSIVPLTAAGTIFTIFFMSAKSGGIINTLLGLNINWGADFMFHFKIGKWWFDIAYAWIPIFLMCFWGGWGGNFIILSAGLQNVPKNLYEAASIDGCGGWRKVMHVTVPNIKGQLVLCLFTTIIGYLGLYGQNYVLFSGGPRANYTLYDATARNLNVAFPASGSTSTIIYFIQDIVANFPDFKEKFYGLGAAACLVFAMLVGAISGLQMYLTRTRKTGNKYSEAFAKWSRIR